MTDAPGTLLDARSLLLTHLGPYGLESAEVGIVGDPNHWGGYHCGKDRVVDNDYSVVESTRDRYAVTQYACAEDVGTFAYGPHNLRTFSVWCVQQCQAGAPDTKDIREIIYSPDGTTVKRWDRLGKRTTGDSSHLYHTHFSFHRDAIAAGRAQSPLFRRYLTTIGLIESEDTMSAEDATVGLVRALNYARNPENPAWTDQQAQYGRQISGALRDILRPLVDQEAIDAAELEAQLNPLRDLVAQAQAGAISADAFVDEVARRLSGTASA